MEILLKSSHNNNYHHHSRRESEPMIGLISYAPGPGLPFCLGIDLSFGKKKVLLIFFGLSILY